MAFEINNETTELAELNKAKKEKLTPPKVKAVDPNTQVISLDENLPSKELLETVPEELGAANAILQAKDLPSEFKLYENDSSTVITFKKYTWAQTLKINSNELPTKILWELILSGIDTDRSLPKLKLTIGDFFYLAFLRRLHTVGANPFVVETNCYNVSEDTGKQCNHLNKYTLHDKDIKFDNMDLPRGGVKATITIDDNTTLEMTPITVEDAFILMRKNLYNDPVAQNAIQVRNMRFDDAFDLLNSDKIDGFVGDDLEEVKQKFYHRVQPIFRDCENCKQPIAILLDMGGTIIKPFREPENVKRLRVHFG